MGELLAFTIVAFLVTIILLGLFEVNVWAALILAVFTSG